MTSVQLAWGIDGARSLSSDCEVVVVVDVLSFTTCVTIATALGAEVRPAAYAEAVTLAPGELLAGERHGGGVSLSPVSVQTMQPGQRLVLPSPNGAAIATQLNGTDVVAASLRNASSVARWLAARGGRIGIVASGEHDEHGNWRPSYEDVLGAGAVIARLQASRTPQAEAAAFGFRGAQDDIARLLAESISGRELVDRGFAADVEVAAQVDVDDVVPVLRDGVFLAAR